MVDDEQQHDGHAAAAGTPGRSPRPDRDAFLRRLEERQRQRQTQQGGNDGQGSLSGPPTEGTQNVPDGGGDTTTTSRADSDQPDQKKAAPIKAFADAGTATSTPGGDRRKKSGIPAPRASSSSVSPPAAKPRPNSERMKHAEQRYEALRQQGTNNDEPPSASPKAVGSDTPLLAAKEEAADATAKKSETALTPAGGAVTPAVAAKTETARMDSSAEKESIPAQPIKTDENADGVENDSTTTTPLVLSYLSECGISLTADLGIFVPATTATGPAGDLLAQRIKDVFDPASLRALLDISRKRKGDHLVLGEVGSGPHAPTTDVGNDQPTSAEGESSLVDAFAYIDRVKEEFADRPAIHDEFVKLMIAFKDEDVDTHTVIRRAVTLFRGHDELIDKFNTYLPEGYRIELIDVEGGDWLGTPASTSDDLNVPAVEKSFEEERWKDYRKARSTASGAAVGAGAGGDKPSASELGQGDDGAGDDTSTVPPLREIRGGAPPAVAAPATGSNAVAAVGTPSYSRRISDLTMPPSLAAASGVGTGASSDAIGGGADTVRTDATVVGDDGSPFAAVQEEEEENIDLSSLEPWQRALFRRIDEQTRLVRQIEGRVDTLAETIRLQQQQQPPFQQPFDMRLEEVQAAVTTRMMEMPQNRDEALTMLQNMHPPPGGFAGGVASQQGQQPLPQQPQPRFFFLPLLETLVDGLVTFFTAPYAVGLHMTEILGNLRPIRLLLHIYREADRRGVLRRFDLSLIFKFIFVSAILAGRTGGARRRRGGNRASGGAELLSLAELWDRHRLTFLLMGTVFALLFQTGFISLVWDVIYKEDAIGMIWRDEDLRAQEAAERAAAGAEAAGNVNAGEAEDEINIRPAGAEAAEGNDAPNGQDGNEADNVPNGGGGVAAAAAQQPARRAPPRRPRQAPPQQPGFFGGGIEPVPANGGFSALGFVVDIIYIIGSLFLSLLPAWHPEPIRRPAPEPQVAGPAADGDTDANNDGGGDIDNGVGGGNNVPGEGNDEQDN